MLSVKMNAFQQDEEEALDGETIIRQGFRQSRQRTNWRYRGTAMTTSDRMDIEAIRVHVRDSEQVLAHIAATFAGLAALARRRLQNNMIESYERIKRVVDFLTISIGWITCYIEFLYLDLEDIIYYVHEERPFLEEQRRRINDLADDNESESIFGFKKNELHLLLLHWRIPLNHERGRLCLSRRRGHAYLPTSY